jgi:DNA-binding SARP family transcriptional activator/streptogramin lyase
MEYRILGPLEVGDDGRQIAITGSKQRALLAILLLHANEVVSRERLIDELWDTSPPETAPAALQVHVSQLRKALGHDAIVTRAPGYLVRVEDGELDLDRFEQLVEDARGKTAPEAAETLREALRVWRGPPLADVDDAVARPERGQLEEQRLSALERRIEAELELGLHAELVPELEALVRADPLRERRRAQLMLALYRSGRQADALDVYSKGRRHLADELGLEPGEELRRLEKAILEHDPALAPPTQLPESETARDGTVRTPTVPRGPAAEEQRRLLAFRRSRRVAVAGALLLAGAIAVGVVALTRGSDASPVAVLPNSVAVMNPESGKVVGDVPIGGRPVGIAIGEGAVWVANGDDQTVLRLDPETFEVVKTIGGLGSEVTDVAVGYGSVWVAGGNGGTVTRIDPRLNAPEWVFELGDATAILPQPVFLVEAGAGGVWVTRGTDLLRINPRTNEVDRSTRVPVGRSMSLGAGAGAAWVIPGESRVLRIDAASGRITADESLPGLGADSPLVVGGSLWLHVYSWTFHDALQLDASSLAQLQSIPIAADFPFGLAAGEDAIWTADHTSGTVWRIDSAEGRAVPVGDVGHHPISIAAGEGSLWIGVQRRTLTFG